jgi:hypothetical protein
MHVIALAIVINYTTRVVNYAPRVTLQIVASLTDNARVIIYNHNVFIVQATPFVDISNHACFCFRKSYFMMWKSPF